MEYTKFEWKDRANIDVLDQSGDCDFDTSAMEAHGLLFLSGEAAINYQHTGER